jgi:hypothetical protein
MDQIAAATAAAVSQPNNPYYELRKNIVNGLINFFDLIFSELPEKTRGDIIYFAHLYFTTSLILWVVLFGQRTAFQIFFVVGFLILAQHFFLRGCVLTKVEHHYRKEKGTTVDVFLRFFEVTPTNENRQLITMVGYSLIYIGAIIIYARDTLLQTRMN